jgi:hypothetical protein
MNRSVAAGRHHPPGARSGSVSRKLYRVPRSFRFGDCEPDASTVQLALDFRAEPASGAMP